MPHIDCRYCNSDHGDRFLCDPAKRLLDAMLEHGQRFDMPTMELDDPVNVGADMPGPGTVLVRQLVAKAAIVPVAGTPRPTLILTGQDIAGGVVPQWVYPGDSVDLRKASPLVRDMTEMAIRWAKASTLPPWLPLAGRWPLWQFRAGLTQIPPKELPNQRGVHSGTGYLADLVPLVTDAHDPVGHVRVPGAADHAGQDIRCICSTATRSACRAYARVVP